MTSQCASRRRQQIVIAALLLGALLFFVWYVNRSTDAAPQHPAARNAEEGAVWSTAIATRPSDGHRIVYRFRSEFRPAFQRTQYPDRVILIWRYESSQGMPSTSERELMDQMEDLLTPHVEQQGVSSLVIVSTGEGLREWIYYARSQQEFMAKLNEALHGVPRFPIEIDLWSDPEWKRYEEFCSSIRQ